MAIFPRKCKPEIIKPTILVPDYANMIDLTAKFASVATAGKVTIEYIAPSHGHFFWSKKKSHEVYTVTFSIVIGETDYQIAYVSVGNDGGHSNSVSIPMAAGDKLKIVNSNGMASINAINACMSFVPSKLVTE